MNKNITISLNGDLQRILDEERQRTGKDQKELIEEILRCHMLLLEFERLRAKFVPGAEALGYHTDEDIFRVVS